MTDKSIRNAVHGLEGDYERLGELLACYEAWGGRPAGDSDCASVLGPKPRDDT